MMMRRELELTPETKKPNLDRWAIKITRQQLHDPSFDLRHYLDSLREIPNSQNKGREKTGAEPSPSIRYSFNPLEKKLYDDETQMNLSASHLSSKKNSNSHLSRHLCTHTTQNYLFYRNQTIMIDQWK